MNNNTRIYRDRATSSKKNLEFLIINIEKFRLSEIFDCIFVLGWRTPNKIWKRNRKYTTGRA